MIIEKRLYFGQAIVEEKQNSTSVMMSLKFFLTDQMGTIYIKHPPFISLVLIILDRLLNEVMFHKMLTPSRESYYVIPFTFPLAEPPWR